MIKEAITALVAGQSLTMEEAAAVMEEIMAGMECERDFECYKSGFKKIGKAKNEGLLGYVECLENHGTRCKFKVPYGDSMFCKCSLRVYVAKELNI